MQVWVQAPHSPRLDTAIWTVFPFSAVEFFAFLFPLCRASSPSISFLALVIYTPTLFSTVFPHEPSLAVTSAPLPAFSVPSVMKSPRPHSPAARPLPSAHTLYYTSSHSCLAVPVWARICLHHLAKSKPRHMEFT